MRTAREGARFVRIGRLERADETPRALRAVADGLAPRRRGADGALQPALRAARAGHLHPADRGHGRRAVARGADGADPLGHGVARARLGRGPLLPVAPLRPLPRGRRAAHPRRARPTARSRRPEELDAERKKAEAAGRAYRYSGAGRDDRARRRATGGRARASATSSGCGCPTRRSSSTT